MVDGKLMRLLVHRKGSTRAFPPHHPLIPVDYQFTGGDVLGAPTGAWVICLGDLPLVQTSTRCMASRG